MFTNLSCVQLCSKCRLHVCVCSENESENAFSNEMWFVGNEPLSSNEKHLCTRGAHTTTKDFDSIFPLMGNVFKSTELSPCISVITVLLGDTVSSTMMFLTNADSLLFSVPRKHMMFSSFVALFSFFCIFTCVLCSHTALSSQSHSKWTKRTAEFFLIRRWVLVLSSYLSD